jgi:hypothetical protein
LSIAKILVAVFLNFVVILQLSWADFVLVGIVETTNLFTGTEIDKKYPSVFALGKTIRSLPGVKEYVAARKPYSV